MSDINSKVTSTPDPQGVLYVKLKDLNLGSQLFYIGGIALGITFSFIALSYYLLPLYLAGTITAYVYYLAYLGISVLWLFIVKLINKFLLQDKLISKGEILCSSKL